MIFSSKVFLFYFLPAVLLIYYLIRKNRKLSNVFLTLASLFFYAWGEPRFVLIMLGSIFMNWLFGIWVDKVRDSKPRVRCAIASMAVFNLGLLAVYKYLTFLLTNVQHWTGAQFVIPKIALPIGISFFTFQAISYVVDVYRGKGKVQRSFMNVCLYISFFPQLIAGPIVRYQTVADEIDNRVENLPDFTQGCQRFMVGLCKKLILANNLGLLVDTAFAMESQYLSVASAWLAACAYLMQVYYDFSGYSDMAIGLGRMFGFHFLENFNFPFISKSIAEFWRRWHISLGSWFTDYVYFPLGGSRVKTKWRLLFNMFVVWSLTGLWHGAAWTYLLWGIGFFIMLAIERLTGLGKWMEKHGALGIFYAMFMVVAVTVMIRADNLTVAWRFYGTMFAVNGAAFWDAATGMFLREYGFFLLAGVICSLPVGNWLRTRCKIPDAVLRIVGGIAILLFTVLAISYVAVVDYNPFIYFNF
ncbi:MAG: MBOAT family O-acyltransferase [Christensenellales bacterium]|nr:MBOAT family O-acyltransferase [Christensenellales bacterium]